MRQSVVDAEQAKMAAEQARRAKLYSIMACIREVQKRNDRTGELPACAGGCVLLDPKQPALPVMLISAATSNKRYAWAWKLA